MGDTREQTWKPGSIAVLDCMVRPGGPDISAEAKLVYLCLFSHWGTKGEIDPGVNRIAAGIGVHRSTVIRKLEELEAAGLIVRDTARGRSNSYNLTPPWHQSHKATGSTEQLVAQGDQLQAATSSTEQPDQSQRATTTSSTEQPEVTPIKKPNEVTQKTLPSAQPVVAVAEPDEGGGKPPKPGSDYTPEFDAFWKVYPRRIGKKAAFRCWNTLLKQDETAERLLMAAENYSYRCTSLRTEERFILHPSTFLGPDKPYEDYLERRTVKAAGSNGASRRPGNASWEIPKEGELQ